MQIDFKLIISALALVLSSISIYFSLKNSRYVQKTKNLELKNSLLSKYYEVKQSIVEISKQASKMREKAILKNDLRLYQTFDFEEAIDKALKKVEKQHEIIKCQSSSMSLKLYESIYHEIHEVAEDAKVIKKRMSEHIEEYEKEQQSKKTLNTAQQAAPADVGPGGPPRLS